MPLPVLLLCFQALPPQFFLSPLPGDTSYLDLPDFGGSPAGPVTRAWAGELTTDRAPDVVLLRGTEVVLLPGPDLYEAALRLPAVANDATIVRGATLSHVATVGAEGLRVWTIDEATQPPGFSATVVDGGANWAGARRVRSFDLNGDTDPDYVGLAADNRTMRVKLSGAGDYQDVAAFTPARAPIDFVIYDRDADGTYEIAVVHVLGLEIFSVTGTQLAAHLASQGSDALVPVRRQAGAPVELAWIRRNTAAGTRYLQLVGPAGLSATTLDLGAMEVAGLAAADFDLDGDEDLALSQRASQALLVLENLTDASAPVAMPFSLVAGVGVHHVATGDVGSADPMNSAAPLWRDIDSDGDLDLLAGIERDQRMLCFRNGAVPSTRPGATHVHVIDGVAETGTDAQLFLDVEYLGGATGPNLKLEVALWERGNVEDTTQSAAIDHQLIAVTEAATIYPVVFDLPGTANGIQSMYAVTIRTVVQAEGATVPFAAGPASTFQFVSTESDPDAPPYFTAIVGSGVPVIVPAYPPGGGEALPGGRDIGVIVPVPDLPDVTPGELPKAPAAP